MIGKTNAISGGGGSVVLISKTITENGTYLASGDSADGYSSVTVDVSNFKKYHVEQTITGNKSTIAITDYVAQESDNYLIGVVVSGDTQKLYIVEE